MGLDAARAPYKKSESRMGRIPGQPTDRAALQRVRADIEGVENDMSPATMKLHDALIRLAKGAIKAWEEWLSAQRGGK